ncbi:MAG TPA: transcription antitermination factor NusB [Gaiellaceae bacterium]|nr:transcription antitermination factor NusB [Gaiellaceae bacterium]
MSVTPARRVAHEVVRRVFEEGAYADRAFRAAAEGLEERERAFAMQLAYGTVQRVRTLDHAIDTLGRRPVRKLDPPVRAALRTGAYQLGYMGGVPAHAAVDEAVELVRRARLERAVPFTNAVMRRLSEGLPGLLARLHEETPEAAALLHSYPDWIARTWWRELGPDDARALMRAQNEPPETAVRTPEGPRVVDAIPREWLESGYAWPQSRGSQLAGAAVGARPGERILDLCAAPGGKATQLAAAGAEVVAVEKHAGRARELEANARRLGAERLTVVHADALELPPGLDGFDRALVDAPCSGLGVLNSRPDLRWRAEPLPDLQLGLLRAAAARVRPGGTVTYAVCTISAAENEDVVDALGLQVESLASFGEELRHPRRPEFLLTLPHVHGTSGFFVARLRV